MILGNFSVNVHPVHRDAEIFLNKQVKITNLTNEPHHAKRVLRVILIKMLIFLFLDLHNFKINL